ncbi:penicillin-binding protein activator [Candidatus Nitrosacidococcus sp. I8]|uniref:penicillin-binding protein activator n=1 Tax=Candidatus Nitrosacidococcus sp. I8 TaxID=2942908 RepID=UPI00222799AD|nr:penicillin-binding protein activator [Candidatus Nitrosacidococcus sp. I8]CAH9019336.1 Penicillin-binding protein activator LpoA [Candidatus Nitrosacidococcus sp. I8]
MFITTSIQRIICLFKFVGLIAIVFNLVACATDPFGFTGPSTKADSLFAKGNYLAAATEYSKLATDAQSPQQEEYQLKASDAFLRGNQPLKAQNILNKIATENLNPLLKLRYRILSAQVALTQKNSTQTLSLLSNIERLEPDSQQQTIIYQLRAEANEADGNLLAAAHARSQLDPTLTDAEKSAENQQMLWYDLTSLSPITLQQAYNQPSSSTFHGWIDLALIAQQYQTVPDRLNEALENWQSKYPNHPASLSLIQDISTDLETPYHPKHIALLLPASGKFSTIAKAIGDGFFTAYYAQNQEDTTIQFYPVTTNLQNNQSDIIEVYQQAKAAGADFIVGPLVKQAVTQLVENREIITLPTLVLNYLEEDNSLEIRNFYQLSLSPEEEVREVANRAWYEGYDNALILTPNSAWGNRIEKALIEQWNQLGGEVLRSQTYNSNQKDYALVIQRLLNINQGYASQKELQEALNNKEIFTLPQDQDPDLIFLIAPPEQARLIVPQLKFYRAENLPIYSTSYIYTGYPDSNQDQDLNGVIFSDIPWVLDKNIQEESSTYRSLAQNNPEDFKLLKRFYALGYDAYQIIPRLKSLHQMEGANFEGATGVLSMNLQGQIKRDLVWAQFKKGTPFLLPIKDSYIKKDE